MRKLVDSVLIVLTVAALPAGGGVHDDTTWQKTNGPYGCKWVYDIEIHPADPDILFIGTNRGIYRSQDGGVSWRELVEGISTDDKVQGIEIDPVDPLTIYAINSEHLYKSVDGGDSWTVLSITTDHLVPIALALDPSEPQTLYVGAWHPQWDSVRDFVTHDLWRSLDGGQNWEAVYSEEGTYPTNVITFSPHDPNVVYLGTGASSMGARDGGGVLVSYDRGATWETLLAGEPLMGRTVFSFTVDPTDPRTLYLGTSLDDDPYGPPGTCFKSTDGGHTWREIVGFALGGVEAVRRIIVDPGNPDTFYVGGDRFILRTDDGGESFYLSSASFRTAGVFQPNVGDYEVVFTDPPTVYAGGYSLLKSTDGGHTFRLINEGIESEMTRCVKLDPFRPERVYSFTAMGSGNAYTHDGGATWHRPEVGIFNQYGMIVELSLTEPDMILATSSVGLWQSFDAGRNWDWVNSQFQNSHVHGLAVDPFDANTIYVGVGRDDTNPSDQGMYKTTDGGATWFGINEGFPDDVHVAEIRIDPTDPQTVYLATRGHMVGGGFDLPVAAGKGVYKSVNGGKSWFPANDGLTNFSITALVVDPQNPQILYAAAASENNLQHLEVQGNVFKSMNGGDTWFPVNEGLSLPSFLEEMPLHIHSLAIDPSDPETVYAAVMDPNVNHQHRGTVFRTTNGGENWELFSEGLTREGSQLTQGVEFLDVDPTGNLLYCATNSSVVYRRGAIPTEDATPPVILAGPALVGLTGNSATVRWHTHERATGIVEYGSSTDYGQVASGDTLTHYHAFSLPDLEPDLTYHFRVGSTDSLGNGPRWSRDFTFSLSQDAEPPAILSVTELPDSPNPGPYSITAEVSDNVDVAASTLFYSLDDGVEFQPLEMTKTGDGFYTADIPAPAEPGYVEYYVESTDTAGNTVRQPAMAPYANYSFRVVDPTRPGASYIYLAAFDGSRVWRLDLATGSVEDIQYRYGSCSSWLGSIAASPDGSILLRTCGPIAGIIDAGTGQTLGAVEAEVCDPSSPHSLGHSAISPDNALACAVKYCGEVPDRIAVLDLENRAYMGDIIDPAHLRNIADIAMSADGTTLYAVDNTRGDAKLLFIDLASRSVEDVIELEENATGIELSRDGRHLYTLTSVSWPRSKSYLVRVDTDTRAFVDSVGFSGQGIHPNNGLILNRKNTAAYVLQMSSLHIIELDTLSAVSSVELEQGEGGWVQDLAITEDDQTLYLPHVDMERVFVLDTRSNAVSRLAPGANTGGVEFVRVEGINSLPNPFALLSPGQEDTLRTTPVRFTWEAASDDDAGDRIRYDLYYGTNRDLSEATVVKEIDGTSWTLEADLPLGIRYWWKVVARDSQDATRECTEALSFVLDSVVEPQPGGPVGDFDGSGAVDFTDFFLFADAFGGGDPRYDLDGSGAVDFTDFFLFADAFGQEGRSKLMALAQQLIGLPSTPLLEQNYPNPFNAQTAVRYRLVEGGWVRLDLYSLGGQHVRSLVRRHQGPGLYRTAWDGTGDDGRTVSSGLYILRLEVEGSTRQRKVMLIR